MGQVREFEDVFSANLIAPQKVGELLLALSLYVILVILKIDQCHASTFGCLNMLFLLVYHVCVIGHITKALMR